MPNRLWGLNIIFVINVKLPATKRFPNVQNAAMKDSIDPLLDFGWNSAKYDQITGPLPPRLKIQNEKYNKR